MENARPHASRSSGDIQYPYAMYETALNHILEARRERAYTCPGCGQQLLPVLGKIRQQHFRHRPQSEQCSPGNALHHMAQMLIQRMQKEAVTTGSPYMCSTACHDCGTSINEVNIAEHESRLTLEDARTVMGTRPDIVVTGPSSTVIIEIVVTHDLEEATREKMTESRLPVYSKELSGFEDLEELRSQISVTKFLNLAALCADCEENARQQRECEEAERRRNEVAEAERRKAEETEAREHNAKVRRWDETHRPRLRQQVRAIGRERSSELQFQPWYETKRDPWPPDIIFPHIQRILFANAVILTEMGFRQRNPDKKWLFSIALSGGVKVYADMGGWNDTPIYRNPKVRVYEFGIDDNLQELKSGLVKNIRERLQREGVDIDEGNRPDDKAPTASRALRHVDRRMVEPLLRDTRPPAPTKNETEDPTRSTQEMQSTRPDEDPEWAAFKVWFDSRRRRPAEGLETDTWHQPRDADEPAQADEDSSCP